MFPIPRADCASRGGACGAEISRQARQKVCGEKGCDIVPEGEESCKENCQAESESEEKIESGK